MGIDEAIRNYRQIMCTTAPIIYFSDEHEVSGAVQIFFRRIKNATEYHAFSSVITLTERFNTAVKAIKEKATNKMHNTRLNYIPFVTPILDLAKTDVSNNPQHPY